MLTYLRILRYKFMFWPMHYLILAFVKWVGFISHTDLQNTNCVSFIKKKNFIIRSFGRFVLFFPLCWPTTEPSTCAVVEKESRREKKAGRKARDFFKWKGSLRTTFKKHWVLIFRMRWNYMKNHFVDQVERMKTHFYFCSRFLSLFLTFHAMTIYSCCYSTENALKERKTCTGNFYHKVFWLWIGRCASFFLFKCSRHTHTHRIKKREPERKNEKEKKKISFQN